MTKAKRIVVLMIVIAILMCCIPAQAEEQTACEENADQLNDEIICEELSGDKDGEIIITAVPDEASESISDDSAEADVEIIEETEESEAVEQSEQPLVLSGETESFVVTLNFEPDVLPEDSELCVKAVKDEKINELTIGEGSASAVLDITVMSGGIEVQPSGEVRLTIELKKSASIELGIYHIGDKGAEKLDSDSQSNTVVTDGFSYYVVEFQYEGSEQFILDGDTATTLANILDFVGIEGSPVSAVSSDEGLFSVYIEDGEIYVKAIKAFQTDETLTVTMSDGITYVISVTDAIYSHYATVSGRKHILYKSDGTLSSYQPTEINLFTINGAEAFCVEPGITVGGTYNEGKTLSEACSGGTLKTAAGGGGRVSTSSAKAEKWYAFCKYKYPSLFNSNGGKAHVAMGIWMALDEAVYASSGYDDLSTFQTVWNAFESWYQWNQTEAQYYGCTTRLYNNGSSSSNQTICIFTPYNNTPQKGNLKIKKVSKNPDLTDSLSCYSLEGAVYQIKKGTTVIGTITTDENGEGTYNNLASGTYTLTEITASEGFLVSSGSTEFTVTAGSTTTLDGSDGNNVLSETPGNDPIFALVRKIDSRTGKAVTLGDGTLAGAEFTFKYYDGTYTRAELTGDSAPAATRTWVFKTNNNGFADFQKAYLVTDKSDELYLTNSGIPTIPFGTVTIQETTPPEGYFVDDTLNIRYVVKDDTSLEGAKITNESGSEVERGLITDNGPIGIPVSEQEFYGSINIEKVRTEKGVSVAEEGAVFQLYVKSKGSYDACADSERDILTTDADGKASSKELPYGTYIIHQTKGTSAFGLADDAEITISADEQTYTARLNNLRMVCSSSCADADGNKLIKAVDNTTIVDTISFENLDTGVSYRIEGRLVDKETGETLKIDNNEITAIKNFIPTVRNGKVTLEYTVDAHKIPGKVLVAYAKLYQSDACVCSHENIDDENQTVEIESLGKVYKYDATAKTPLAGVMIEIKDVTDNVTATVITGADGYAEFVTKKNHSYEVKELAALSGYMLNNHVYTFTVNSKGEMSRTIKIANPKNDCFMLYKYDLTTGKPLEGACITVYREKDDGTLEEIYYDWTDACGYIYLQGLREGTYWYEENEAPTGYYINEYMNSFTVDKDGVVKGRTSMYDAPYGVAVIRKLSKDGRYLEGAVLSLYSADGTYIATGTTDEEGKVWFNTPGEGEYYFTEDKAPDGYIRLAERTYFTVHPNGRLSGSLKLINYPYSPVPKTEDSDSPLMWLVLAIVSGSMLSMAVLLRKKRE